MRTLERNGLAWAERQLSREVWPRPSWRQVDRAGWQGVRAPRSACAPRGGLGRASPTWCLLGTRLGDVQAAACPGQSLSCPHRIGRNHGPRTEDPQGPAPDPQVEEAPACLQGRPQDRKGPRLTGPTGAHRKPQGPERGWRWLARPDWSPYSSKPTPWGGHPLCRASRMWTVLPHLCRVERRPAPSTRLSESGRD